jgi:hypothetical protein
VDKQSLLFLCGAFLLLHPQSDFTNAGPSENEKKLNTKPKKKQRGRSVAESERQGLVVVTVEPSRRKQ